MMRKLITIYLALLILISLRPTYAQQAREYSEADDVIEAEVGDNIVIRLEDNQILGLKWQLREPLYKEILELVNIEYTPGMARFRGRGGREIWTIKVLRPGETTISLKYIEQSKMNAKPIKIKVFTVIIKGPPRTESMSEQMNYQTAGITD